MRTDSQTFGFGDQAKGLRQLLARGHAQVITVLGAHDGLGATSVVTNLAALFAQAGQDVLVLDENLSHDNVANTLALRPRYDLLHAARGDKHWQEILLPVMAGVVVLPVARAMQALPVMAQAERERLLSSLLAAAAGRDVVLVDAARDGNSLCASLSGDEPLLLVLNATASGIKQSYLLLKKMALHDGRRDFDIVVNRVGNAHEALAVFDNMQQVAQQHLQVRPRRGGAEPSGAGQRSCGVGSCAQRVMPEPTGASHLLPQTADFVGNVSEVRPRRGGAEPSGAGAGASHLLPQTADFVGNVSEVRLNYLGHIPVDDKVKRATQLCRPVVEAFPSAAASLALREIAQRLLRAPADGAPMQDRLGSVLHRVLRMTPARGKWPASGNMAVLT